MSELAEQTVCNPIKGNVFPGTWPDCPDCHGQGFISKNEPNKPCPTCQRKSEQDSLSLDSFIKFDYYGRPKNFVKMFPLPGEKVQSEWIDLTWAELHGGVGVPAGTWPDCPDCKGIGQKRYEAGWDGHRTDYERDKCRTCQPRTKRFHIEHPNEKDLLLQRQKAELDQLRQNMNTQLEEMSARHQAELEAFPY